MVESCKHDILWANNHQPKENNGFVLEEIQIRVRAVVSESKHQASTPVLRYFSRHYPNTDSLSKDEVYGRIRLPSIKQQG